MVVLLLVAILPLATGLLAHTTRKRPSLAYIKVPKTGSSSFGGVLRRIGSKHGYAHVHDGDWLKHKKDDEWDTSVWAFHGRRKNMDPRIDKHLRNPIFITSVRDPKVRCMSLFYYFGVGRHHVDPADVGAKLAWLQKRCGPDCMTNYISPRGVQGQEGAVAAYDVILVEERFDESLLALKQFLSERGVDVTYADLLYLSAKESGKKATDGKDKAKADGANTILPTHPSIDDEPQEILDWLEDVFGKSSDAALVVMANKKLDDLKVSKAELAAFKESIEQVEDQCGQYVGEDCLWNDGGCGQSCIDEFAKTAPNSSWLG